MTMQQLQVGLAERSYPIWIGAGVLPRLGEALQQVEFPRHIALVSNATVWAIYGEALETELTAAGYRLSRILIPDGEAHKTLQTLELIFDQLIEGGFDRHSGLLALGGGVIGDITGFAAATYLRGVPFVQVPTTLLAQVDSSVGGKTAVNHRLGKNLIGAFYQPRHVHIDVATLHSLPEREFSAGLAEVIKYGVIRDAEFFRWLQEHAGQLQQRDEAALVHAVRISCQIKANVVELDETEASLRAILNFGHTFGHAVESLAGYGTILHGEAVAIGMCVAAQLSVNAGLCRPAEADALRALLSACGLPTDPPDFSLDDYLAVMQRDKKVQQGTLRVILNRGIGDCVIHQLDDPAAAFGAALQQLR